MFKKEITYHGVALGVTLTQMIMNLQNLGDYRYDHNDYLAFVASIKFDNNSLNYSDFDDVVHKFDDLA